MMKKKRKNTYPVDDVLVEGLTPHESCAPLSPSVLLHERASPRLRRGAIAVLHLRLRLSAPFTTMLVPVCIRSLIDNICVMSLGLNHSAQ